MREFTDPGRMAAEAAAQGIGHLLLSPWVRLLPFEHPLAEARDICKVQNDALAAITMRSAPRNNRGSLEEAMTARVLAASTCSWE